MGSEIDFHIVKTLDNKTQFTKNNITITTDDFSYKNGKHQLLTPLTADAHFVCRGKLYMMKNMEAVVTVEDWYQEELLPKFQMLSVLKETSEV